MLSLATSLNEISLHNVASWFQDVDGELELDKRARPISLRSASLNVTKLEMVSSALSKMDMSNLVKACRKLNTLYY